MPSATLLPLLKSTFGFDAFRGAQGAVLDRVMAGASTLAVMPTGAGKSLTYQLPALALPGTVVVISPLIALMHDQLRSARAVGIRAATLTSVDTDRDATEAALVAGDLDILYLAPERATGDRFHALLSRARVALFAIDEAHCVSEWGHDFRPDYRLLRPLLDAFGHVPRLALTATADAHTRADILYQLGIPDDGLVLAGFDRPNITYAIRPRDGLPGQLAALMDRVPGPGIIYAPTRNQTEQLADTLARVTGRAVTAYHAGLDPDLRARRQADFVASEDAVVVATVAFGMGIDKPDVRFVAHAGLPKSIEGYYQETGRAGRDGDPAVAELFWSASDFATARQRLSEVPADRQEAERQRLAALAGLVETTLCRRAVLLRHFGETPPAACGACDNCLDPPQGIAVSELARKLLSAVYRTGQSFGVGHLEAVLLGQDTDRVTARGHDRLSVYGIVEAAEAPLIRPLVRTLTAADALRGTEHGGLMLGPAARPILKGEVEVTIAAPPRRRAGRRGAGGTGGSGGGGQGAGQGGGASLNPVGDPLFEALRALRRDLAAEGQVPPYVIFHDSVLRDMTRLRPQTLGALGELPGIGKRKRDAYGEAFLAVIRQY